MSTTLIVFIVLGLALAALPVSCAELAAERWTAEKANAWYERQPWPCGFTYVPADKIWQHDLFRGDFKPYDAAEIETLKQALHVK